MQHKKFPSISTFPQAVLFNFVSVYVCEQLILLHFRAICCVILIRGKRDFRALSFEMSPLGRVGFRLALLHRQLVDSGSWTARLATGLNVVHAWDPPWRETS